MYTTKELQHLEKILEKKLFDLEIAEQNAKTPTNEMSELSLTKNILKFVQYLVIKEMSQFGFLKPTDPSSGVGVGSGLLDSFYDYGYGTGGSVPMPNTSSFNIDTSTICENCRMKNPQQTHCVHRCISACDGGMMTDFGLSHETTKANKPEEK